MISVDKILCPVDFSTPSYAALDAAVGLAAQYASELHIIHVVEPLISNSMIGKTSYRLYQKRLITDSRHTIKELIRTRVGKRIKTHSIVKNGDPAKEIVKTAIQKNIDVIVIATHGRKGWGHLLFGSIAEKVVRLAPCPVLVIHAPKKRTRKRSTRKRKK